MEKKLRNKGFTLIELVIVIVILGILSVTAVPKFISLRSDAVLASMDSLVGVIKSADQLVYMKAVISNVSKSESATVTINDQDITLVYGYPAGTDKGIVKVIENNAFSSARGATVDYSNGYWHSRKSTHPGGWVYWPSIYGKDAGGLRCYIRYNQATLDSDPIIDLETADCD